MTIIHGLHHVTAVTANAKNNLIFYTEVLGLRLVKKTVNQDDVSAYHLFYADAEGNPGTDITFFDWKQAGEKIEGTDQVSRTYFRVSGASTLKYWEARFTELHVVHGNILTINNKDALLFEDPEGQRLGLIDDSGLPFDGKIWDQQVPAEFSLRGFYTIEITVPDLETVEIALVDILEWEKNGTYNDPQNQSTLTVFSIDGGGPGKEVHVRELAGKTVPTSTAGSVHHVAFRLQNDGEMREWLDHLIELGVQNSGIVDRFYFKSLYFRISPGILFELATEGPGFSIDEEIEHLGKHLSLPPFLEQHRREIEEGLSDL